MNKLQGKILVIETFGDLSYISVLAGDIVIKSIIIENQKNKAYLQKGALIYLFFKETEVILAKEEKPLSISLPNRIPGEITGLEEGALLSKLSLKSSVGKIVSIITTESLKDLNLQIKDQVIAMIKTNEIMLSIHD